MTSSKFKVTHLNINYVKIVKFLKNGIKISPPGSSSDLLRTTELKKKKKKV